MRFIRITKTDSWGRSRTLSMNSGNTNSKSKASLTKNIRKPINSSATFLISRSIKRHRESSKFQLRTRFPLETVAFLLSKKPKLWLEAEKDNFFQSFSEGQREFQERKLDIQKRINVLQENLESCIQSTGKFHENNRTMVLNSELKRNNQRETPKPHNRTNYFGLLFDNASSITCRKKPRRKCKTVQVKTIFFRSTLPIQGNLTWTVFPQLIISKI